MAIVQHRAQRKSTGGRYKSARKKRIFELGGVPSHTHLAERKLKTVRGRGGTIKHKLLSAKIVNVIVGGKAQQATIQTVKENPANVNFIRRNIITKGAIVQTEIGKVRITSRPGQEGVLNGVKVE